MTKVLMVVTAAKHWTLNDGTPHPTGGCPILCVRGFGLQVVRESVGVSHG